MSRIIERFLKVDMVKGAKLLSLSASPLDLVWKVEYEEFNENPEKDFSTH